MGNSVAACKDGIEDVVRKLSFRVVVSLDMAHDGMDLVLANICKETSSSQNITLDFLQASVINWHRRCHLYWILCMGWRCSGLLTVCHCGIEPVSTTIRMQ